MNIFKHSTKEPSKGFISKVVITIFLYWAVLGAFYYYFYNVPASNEIEGYYSAFIQEETSFTEKRIREVLNAGGGTRFENMVIHSAFMRYRLSSEQSGIFEKYMDYFQGGVWRVPETGIWRDIFSEYETAWDNERSDYVKSGKLAQRPNVSRGHEEAIILDFPEATTPILGTNIELTVEVPAQDVLGQPVTVLWGFQDMETPMRKLVNWEAQTTATSQGIIAKLNVNYSLETTWYQVEKPVKPFTVIGPEVSKWRLKSVRLLD